MKTNFIYQMKAMRLSTIILISALLPLISYGTISQNSNILTYLEVHYEISEEEIFENWMTDVKTWSNEVSGTDSEEELETEKWMLAVDDNSWHDEAIEDKIQFEAWMVSVDSIFLRLKSVEEEIQIENWMLTPSSWLGNR